MHTLAHSTPYTPLTLNTLLLNSAGLCVYQDSEEAKKCCSTELQRDFPASVVDSLGGLGQAIHSPSASVSPTCNEGDGMGRRHFAKNPDCLTSSTLHVHNNVNYLHYSAPTDTLRKYDKA